jgi:hypothetical protein
MFFLKKKKAAETQQQGFDVKSRAPRYSCLARIEINSFDGQAVLKNVSVGGFRMESRTYAALEVEKRYQIWITPEADAGIPRFELEVEVRWILNSAAKFAAGLLVTSLAARPMEKYIEYLKLHSADHG